MELDAKPPEEGSGSDLTIWRYMDLSRFISMLSTSKLWFAKAATLHDDPWEGFGTAEWFKAPLEDCSPKWITHETDHKKTNISVPQMIDLFGQMSAEYYEHAGEHLYVNSWCLGATESMAMWQIYGSLGSGIAVESSVERYKRAARFEVGPSYYEFGGVKYHDELELAPEIHGDYRMTVPAPGTGVGREILKLAFHKRSCYSYEREWRAAFFQGPRPEVAGLHETFDLDELISKVYVGPRAQGFLFDVVAAVMDKFALQKMLRRSELLSAPRKGRSEPQAQVERFRFTGTEAPE